MVTQLQSKNIWLLIVSLLLIVSGIYVLLNPITALVASALTIGVILILIGTSYLVIFKQSHSYMMLTLGILDMLIGILFLTNIGVTAMSMPIIFALWILFNGIAQLVMGLEMKEMNIAGPGWKWLSGSGVFGILFALLIFIYPALGTATLTLLLGIYLIGYGGFELNRYLKDF